MPGALTNGVSHLDVEEMRERFETLLQDVSPSSTPLGNDMMNSIGRTILRYVRYDSGLAIELWKDLDVLFFMWERKRQAENDTDELYNLAREIEAEQPPVLNFDHLNGLLRNCRRDLNTIYQYVSDVRDDITARVQQSRRPAWGSVMNLYRKLDAFVDIAWNGYVVWGDNLVKLRELERLWRAAEEGMRSIYGNEG
ncbi:hypothetical protein CP532_4538 [Ophiocordyceps camponoti-leonardi (nom. inval.)]|nr:hypothetical protein CP532_4538 [Ophiocordyceps camponoti-leonardi (nom. inval.)]